MKALIFSVSLAMISIYSTISAAALITHNGYSLDTDTNIVTGGGLEWLQWDETMGESVDTATAAYAGAGWVIASNLQMSILFNAFNFGAVFDSDETTTQYQSNPYTPFPSPITDINRFIALFGVTYFEDTSPNDGDDQYASSAYFGRDPDSDGKHNLASVITDYYKPANLRNPYGVSSAGMYSDIAVSHGVGQGIGVALIRETQPGKVPAPSTLVLILIGMFGLYRKRLNK